MIVIVSIWIIEDGFARREGEAPRPAKDRGAYHCSLCGGQGHSRRTCGRASKH